MNILETDASTTKYHTILKAIPVQKPIKAHLPYSLADIGVSLLWTTNKINPTRGIKNDNTFNPADGVSSITLALCCVAPQFWTYISLFTNHRAAFSAKWFVERFKLLLIFRCYICVFCLIFHCNFLLLHIIFFLQCLNYIFKRYSYMYSI